jgi:hypothetical protein
LCRWLATGAWRLFPSAASFAALSSPFAHRTRKIRPR